MSTPFDTTPTVHDLAAARDLWASIVADHPGAGWMDYPRYVRASRVAIELGEVMRELVAESEAWAREAARARALYEEWMRP
jgi:hypothetical protein